MEEKKEELFDKICEQINKKLEELAKVGIQQTNIDYVMKLIDIKKDISKINLMEMEEDNMRYDGYGNYGNYDNYGARMRDSRGRYMGNDNYGRRYRGHDMIDDMSETYGTYMANKENGRYGSPESTKSFDYMLKSAKDFFGHLFNEASSQEEVEKIRRTAREISEM